MLVSYDSGNASNTSDVLELQAGLAPAQVDQAKAKAREMEQMTNRVVNARGCSGWAGELITYRTAAAGYSTLLPASSSYFFLVESRTINSVSIR